MKNVIIVPTYNEKENIRPLIKDIFKYVPDVHILVIDDNSPDGTALEVKNIMIEHKNVSLLSRAGKEGLGKAYLNAFSELSKDPDIDYVVVMDADFSHSPSYLPEMFKMAPNYDVVVGSRYIGGENSGTEGWELWRRVLSKFGNLYCRFITGMSVKDSTAGFMLIRKELLDEINAKDFDVSGYAFMMELKYTLWKKGSRFKEVPIIFKNRRQGESKLSSHIIAEGIIAPWRMRFKK
ncbi:MAG: polyprenol monophosphomannose synthase [Patescibacteria group bacterium]|nr:polyprenol monophosphomannose synthase [Patescibacteria group bacterium]